MTRSSVRLSGSGENANRGIGIRADTQVRPYIVAPATLLPNTHCRFYARMMGKICRKNGHWRISPKTIAPRDAGANLCVRPKNDVQHDYDETRLMRSGDANIFIRRLLMTARE